MQWQFFSFSHHIFLPLTPLVSSTLLLPREQKTTKAESKTNNTDSATSFGQSSQPTFSIPGFSTPIQQHIYIDQGDFALVLARHERID